MTLRFFAVFGLSTATVVAAVAGRVDPVVAMALLYLLHATGANQLDAIRSKK